MRLIDGDLWPEHDTVCREAALSQLPTLLEAISYCRHKRIAVQAGGNCGVWPRELGRHFSYVYTFEPDAENFQCLAQNASAHNIYKFQAGLGSEHKTIAMNTSHKNIGAHHMAETLGAVPIMRVDDLCLPVCDFMELDIEGYEYFALKGAEHTIKTHRPVIQIEHKRHAERYGLKPEEVIHYLNSLGYREAKRLGRDILFLPEA
jgi:FkbM family methyltransferase